MCLKMAEAALVCGDYYTGTSLPPDEPQGENPPDGAMVDYALPQGAGGHAGVSGPVTLEILGAGGKGSRRDLGRRGGEAEEQGEAEGLVSACWAPGHGGPPAAP